MEAEKKAEQKKFLLPEALALAIASSVIYLLSFLYERGYASHFGIPTQFISVSLTTLLIFGAGAVTFLYISINIAGALLPFLRHEHPYLAFHLPRAVIFFFLLVLIPLYLLRGSNWTLLIVAFFCWLAMVLFLSIGPLFIPGRKGGLKERMDAALEAGALEPPTIYDLISARSGIRNFNLYVAGLIVATLLADVAGLSEATRQRDFLVTNTTPEMVVLRVYGENMICARFDREKHEVKKSFSVLKVAEDSNLVLNLEKVGPLNPVEMLASEVVVPSPTPAPPVESTPSIAPTPAPTESPKSENQPSAEQKPAENK